MITTDFLESLSKFRLALSKHSDQNMSGNRKSSQKGTSTEFSGFREYIPGDDLRRIDWNAYGRLNKLYIKEYMEEKETLVRILIDTSASMNYGSSLKSELACKLALAFSYMSVNNMDRVILYDLKHPDKPYRCVGGKKAVPGLLDWLNHLDFSASFSLSEAIQKLPARGNGITILISDFLEENMLPGSDTLHRMLQFLRYQKQKIILLHVMSSEELYVNLTGTLNLIDMEEENTLKVTMENKSLSLYEQSLQSFLEHIKNEASGFDTSYCLCDSGCPFEQLLFEKLRFAYDI